MPHLSTADATPTESSFERLQKACEDSGYASVEGHPALYTRDKEDSTEFVWIGGPIKYVETAQPEIVRENFLQRTRFWWQAGIVAAPPLVLYCLAAYKFADTIINKFPDHVVGSFMYGMGAFALGLSAVAVVHEGLMAYWRRKANNDLNSTCSNILVGEEAIQPLGDRAGQIFG
ncbi:MAG: hypothetical protein QF486_06650 [Candidatus Woesearchaeota archaeon]|jgi:hypothetical protein|nr:hypothetical protein [Candidatus Woesearchaeota archaeon]MDP7199266.1 hypothetical protein [Candidatus Woesearchaeota archaeon]MDP7467927.1 hypothetical protein [Candidatus Woesearchaeota archaeon]MDP7647869.1 hypothetical protein [Candidatus Woesearchaeota archaeon]